MTGAPGSGLVETVRTGPLAPVFKLASSELGGLKFKGRVRPAFADLDGDGKPDLISANYGNGTLTVFTNNANGGFGHAATPAVGAHPGAGGGGGGEAGPSGRARADGGGAPSAMKTSGTGTRGKVKGTTSPLAPLPLSLAPELVLS